MQLCVRNGLSHLASITMEKGCHLLIQGEGPERGHGCWQASVLTPVCSASKPSSRPRCPVTKSLYSLLPELVFGGWATPGGVICGPALTSEDSCIMQRPYSLDLSLSSISSEF